MYTYSSVSSIDLYWWPLEIATASQVRQAQVKKNSILNLDQIDITLWNSVS